MHDIDQPSNAKNVSSTSPVAFTESRADALRKLDFPQGMQLRQFSNAHEHVFYEEERIHTFSMYLEGGFQTTRTDINSAQGAPGRFCLMPAGSYSAWQIGGAQKFMHVYFGDDYIKRLALENFDIDPRLVALPHLTFEKSESLMALAQHGVSNWDWSEADNQMMLQHNVQTVLLNLLKTVGVKKLECKSLLKAGLSPYCQKQLIAFIDANFRRQIYLSELAELSGLSEFHFARMFKLSFASTPQSYITDVRVEKLQHRIRAFNKASRPGMAQLALEHGFSSQSHMGRVFKDRVGVTPGQFLKLND